jgi:hypothetical protein
MQAITTKRMDKQDASFYPDELAATLRSPDTVGVTTLVAAALVNEFTDEKVAATDGQRESYDVLFPEAGVLVKHDAASVCHENNVTEKDDGYYILGRGDNRVLALNTDRINTNLSSNGEQTV